MRKLHWLGLLVLAAVFIAVFVTVLNFRISKGDIYKHYSTYRYDPLGSSALLEALQSTSDVEVNRNLQDLNNALDFDADTTFFLNGIPRGDVYFLSIRVFNENSSLQEAVAEGARLVITINPVFVPKSYEDWFAERDRRAEEKKAAQDSASKSTVKEAIVGPSDIDPIVPSKPKGTKAKGGKGPKAKAGKGAKAKGAKGVKTKGAKGPKPVLDIFGFGIAGASIAELKDFERPDDGWLVKPEKAARPYKLKQLPIWKSHLRLELEGKEWKVIASVDGDPVVAERTYGKGKIIITSDAFFTSNQALYSDADSDFLVYLVGDKKKILFDETQHGTIERPGVMSMVLRFRLQGIFVGLLIFLLLWAWRSSNSLTPINESLDRGTIDSEGSVIGKGSSAGLMTLLKRSISGKELIHRCLATWRGSQLTQISPEKEEELDAIHRRFPDGSSPEEHYQEIAKVLRKR